MDFVVFGAVIFAAFLHASWNVLVKLKLDPFSSVVLLQTVLGIFGLGLLVVFGLPPREAWPYALVSGVVHTFYLSFLAKAYEKGDFSLTYPILRGTAPLFTLIGSVTFAGDYISWQAAAGILVLIAGLMALAFAKTGQLETRGQAVFYALLTAVTISCYTIIDGLGARAAGNPSQYAGLTFFTFGIFIFCFALWRRGRALMPALLPHWKRGIIGGSVSAVAYWIIIWCMVQAPIAMVAALRETSVLFGIMLSSYFLKERLTPIRIAGGVLIVAGAAILRLS